MNFFNLWALRDFCRLGSPNIASGCDLMLRIPSENYALSAEFPRDLALAMKNHSDRNFRSPHFGVGGRGSPRFVPICSDFPVFFRFVPVCAPCFREYPDLFRFVPICSDLFRFVFRTNQNKSGKPLSADPFRKSPKFVILVLSVLCSYLQSFHGTMNICSRNSQLWANP